jgi:hypothetical protein
MRYTDLPKPKKDVFASRLPFTHNQQKEFPARRPKQVESAIRSDGRLDGLVGIDARELYKDPLAGNDRQANDAALKAVRMTGIVNAT